MPLVLDRHTPSSGMPELQRRGGVVAGVVVAALFVLVGRLWQLQIIRGDDYYKKTKHFVHEHRVPAVRGLIKDRRGVTLVDNRPSYSVYVTLTHFSAESRATLIQVLGLSADEVTALDARLAKARARRQGAEVLVLEDVSPDRLALIEQARADLPGVEVHDGPHRFYPHGTLAAHVLGYLNEMGGPEIEARRDEGYEDGDYVGRYGIEKEWESYLRGKKGREYYVVDAKNRKKTDAEADDLLDGYSDEPPVPGHNVVLTIDVELQRIAERALRNRPAGGIAVVDVKTGKVLALVSKPGFDPNVMTGHLSRAEEQEMLADPFKPFLDKTLRQHYYPGSTYKFVTAIAALEDGKVSEEERILCKGWHELGRHSFRCTKQHGLVDMAHAMAQSCNVYFWQLAERVGMDRIGDVARDFGFGAPTGVGLNGDVPGRVPWKSWYEKAGGFRIGYTLNTAVGQGDTVVTVLQLAAAYAALGNGGNLWIPQLVERVETATGQVVKDFMPRLRHRVSVSTRALAAVQRGLWGTVNDAKGTAYATRLTAVEVAGKTGTAQVRKLQKQPEGGDWHPDRDHAWFAGYAPANDPQIAVVVLVEHGGKGGHVAAPLAMEIVRGYFEIVEPGAVKRPVAVELSPLPGDGAVATDGTEGRGAEGDLDEGQNDEGGLPTAIVPGAGPGQPAGGSLRP
jgi:penicillin-binding protein 2